MNSLVNINKRKLLKRIRKTTTITRKQFGSIRDIMRLRRAYDKYANVLGGSQCTIPGKLMKIVKESTELNRKRFGSMSDLIKMRRTYEKYMRKEG